MHSSLPLALVLLFAAAGCSSTPEPQPSGFLGDIYAEMKVDPNTGTLLYRAQDADFDAYSKVMLDRVEVWVDMDDRYKGASWMDVRRCAELFGESMRAALADGYPIVEEPGPDVLRIRLAVTGLQADVEGYSTRANLGYGDPDTVDQVAATGTALDIERITVEADFVDSSTDERLVATLVQRSANPTAGETSWEVIESVFQRMAQRVREGLDASH